MKPIRQILTWSIAALAAGASAGGLLLSGLYRDSEFYKAAWQANDAVTLLLIPVLLLSHNRMATSQAAKVVWVGLVAYMFYNYAFYLFGAAFNWFFLVYVLIFASSFYTLILAVLNMQTEMTSIVQPVRGRIWIAAFLLLTAVPLAGVEVKQYVDFLRSGDLPEIPVLILALDLSLIVPTAILAAVLLISKYRWGYWLGGIMLVKSFCYGLVLVTGTLFITIKKVGILDPLLPFYIFISLGGIASLLMLLHPHDRKLAI